VCARRGFIQDRSGSALLEFAVLGPVFILFVIGFFQVAWAMYCSHSVRYALHNSARALVLNPAMSQSDLQAMVQAAVSPLVAQDVAVSLTKTFPNAGLQLATATATYDYQIVTPFMPTYHGHFSTTFVESSTSF
jgi:Flp pilus assembly protein TadG